MKNYDFGIKSKRYVIDNIHLDENLLSMHVRKFWSDIFTPLATGLLDGQERHLYLMCKLRFIDEEMGNRTLGHLRIVNYEDKDLYAEYLIGRFSSSGDPYHSYTLDSIIFTYIIKEGRSSNESRMLLRDLSNKPITKHRFINMDLPITMIPSEYGRIVEKIKKEDHFRYIVSDDKRRKTYQIDAYQDGTINKTSVLGHSDFTWEDFQLEEGFKRVIGKSIFYFVDGIKVLKMQNLNAKAINRKKKEKDKVDKFFTADIETVRKNGEHVPYLIGLYDGESSESFYIGSNEDVQVLVETFIQRLLYMYHKCKSITIYVHNLNGFDANFILKYLEKYGSVYPWIVKGNTYSIELRSSTGLKIIFKDSYLMLPRSLRTLCTAFNVKNSKGYFPFLMNDYFYNGIIPIFSYWSNTPIEEFQKIVNKFTGKNWNFREESIKYCLLDCVSLHEVLTLFNNLIFEKFSINMTKYLTLSSLAIAIYRTHYMPKDTIYKILGNVEKEIRESYTGGAVDVYITSNIVGDILSKIKKKLFYLDANSLYPSVMHSNDMPIGKPRYFEGDILRFNPNAFGFFYCKITSPEYLEHPILQRRVKTKTGVRTIAGLGSWEGYIFSEEMRNAEKYGYQFEVIKGYEFDRGNIFMDYVSTMYNFRKDYPKSHPMNYIAKLLLNSLYGKLGMNLDLTRTDIYSYRTDEEKGMLSTLLDIHAESITEIIPLVDSYVVVRSIVGQYDDDEYLGRLPDVNVAIASAVTAYARAYMSQFKNNEDYNLYYSDTDSIVIDKMLPEVLVGDNLGQMKLEHEVDKAIFLAPKVYGIETTSGEKIIKIKGVKDSVSSELTINDLGNLLQKDTSREFTNEKWFKNLFEGKILIRDVAYQLKMTSNKRKLVYDNNNFVIKTKPYNYDELN